MIETVLNYVLWGDPVASYLKVLAAFVGGVIVLRIVKFVVVKRVAAWAKKADVPIDDVFVNNIAKPLLPLLYLGTVYLALGWLKVEADATRWIEMGGKVLLTFFGGRFVIAVLINIAKYYWVAREENGGRERTFKALTPIIKIVVWVIALIFLLDNLGFEVTTVVAGLGIGGVAVALAGQAILKDLFGYFSILFDRPFEIGDLIAVGDKMGTVEKVGIKTTRLKSVNGEQLVFSNADLTDSRVQNYKRMARRRVVFNVGVTYETPAKDLEEIPAVAERIIGAVKGADFDRAHFRSYGDSSLNFEIVYYVRGHGYKKDMDIQQQINLALFNEFSRRKIDFAYPTQTLYLPEVEKKKGKK